MQAGDHIQAGEKGPQDSNPSTSYSTTTSESTARWDAKKRAVKVPPLLPTTLPLPLRFFSIYTFSRSWCVIRTIFSVCIKKDCQNGLL